MKFSYIPIICQSIQSPPCVEFLLLRCLLTAVLKRLFSFHIMNSGGGGFDAPSCSVLLYIVNELQFKYNSLF